MKITYLDCDGRKNLFSFYAHHCNTFEDYMIDGGVSIDPDSYIRTSSKGKIKEGEIKDLIFDIRQQFTWTQNYDKDNNRVKSVTRLLEDLTSSHICGILRYFTEKLYKDNKEFRDFGHPYTHGDSWFIIHSIFIQELDYRINNNLI